MVNSKAEAIMNVLELKKTQWSDKGYKIHTCQLHIFKINYYKNTKCFD